MDFNQQLEEKKNKTAAAVMQKQNALVEDLRIRMRPEELDIAQFNEQQRTFTTGRRKEDIKASNIEIARFEKEGYESEEAKMRLRAQKMENDSELLIRDKKWYNLFNRESQEMKDVKASLAYLNNCLNGDVPYFERKEGEEPKVNLLQMRKDIVSGYVTAFRACDKYLQTHRDKGKHSTGERRKNKVKQMMKTLEREQKFFEVGIDNALNRVLNLDGIKHPREVLVRVRAEEALISRYMIEGNSSDVHRVKVKAHAGENGKKLLQRREANETKQQFMERLRRSKLLEGNLYVKVDEKLLNEDLPGYLDRRIASLTRSKQKREAIREKCKDPKTVEDIKRFVAEEKKRIDIAVSEKRMTKENAEAAKKDLIVDETKEDNLYRLYAAMQEGKIRDIDTEIERRKQWKAEPGQNKEAFEAEKLQFEVDKNKEIHKIRNDREELRLEGRLTETDYNGAIEILSAMKEEILNAGNDAKAVIDRYVEFFKHDFDKFFEGLQDYNNQVKKIQGDKDALQNIVDKLKEDPDKLDEGRKMILKTFERTLAEGGLKEKTELEWIEENLEDFGLTKADRVYRSLKTLSESAPDALSKFFKRSLGKEAELFGQQAQRSGLTDSELLASNNTATSRLAGIAGFDDVVTTSFKSILSFDQMGKDNESVEMVTMSEEARGEEMLSLVEEAENLRKLYNLEKSPIHYTPQAMRQLNRLQVFDALTLQTDRHWRNFKCDVARVNDEDGNPMILIKSVKSYDHDQSFGPKSLEEYFEDEKNPETGEIQSKREGFLPPLMMTVDKKSTMYKYISKTKMKSAKIYGNVLDDIKMPIEKSEYLEKESRLDYLSRIGDNPGHFKHPDNLYEYKPWQLLLRLKAFSPERNHVSRDFVKGALRLNPGKEKLLEDFYQKFAELQLGMIDRDDRDFPFRSADQFTENDKEREKQADAYAKAEKQRLDPDGTRRYSPDYWDLLKEEHMLKHPSKKKIIKLFKEVYLMYQQLDLSELEKDVTGYLQEKNTDVFFTTYKRGNQNDACVGYMDYCIQSFFHMAKGYLSQPENKKIFDELEKEDEKAEKQRLQAEYQDKFHDQGKDGKKLSKGEIDQAVKEELEKEKSPTIKVPAMLHMDKAAYDSIKYMYDHWEGETLLYLIDLGWVQKKYDALKKRMEEIIATKEQAEAVLKEWADAQGLPEDHVARKYLLEEDEWEQIQDIQEIALDPGNSYYSIEDTGYLTSDFQYRKHMGRPERVKALAKANQEREAERVKKVGKIEGDTYHTMVDGKVLKYDPVAIEKKQREDELALKNKVAEPLLKDEKLAKLDVETFIPYTNKEEVKNLKRYGTMMFSGNFEMQKFIEEELKYKVNQTFDTDEDFVKNFPAYHRHYIMLSRLYKDCLAVKFTKDFVKRTKLPELYAKMKGEEKLHDYLYTRYRLMTNEIYLTMTKKDIDSISDDALKKRAETEEDPKQKEFYQLLKKYKEIKFEPYDIENESQKYIEDGKKQHEALIAKQ